MPEIKKYSIKDKLLEADKKYDHKASVVGMSSMTFPGYINSTRTQMFTSHLKQILNILYPQFPFVFTGAENTVGENSSGYKKADGDLEVIKKIVKYGDIIDNPFYYFMFVFNRKKNRYELLYRQEVEDLTEDFAYMYNNETLDNYLEGDVIPDGTVIYKSYSYDEYMNYCYGINAVVEYVLDPWTSEDAAVISDVFSEAMSSIKVKDNDIGINNNEIPLNIYGDKDNYKIMPDIGEACKPSIIVTRPLYNDQVYYDMKSDNLFTIKDGDRCFYTNGRNSKIIDYDIFCNNDDIKDNVFNKQILKYLKSQDRFWKDIKNVCQMIRKSGFEYTQDIEYIYKRCKEFLDYKKKWINKNDNGFGNIEIHAKTFRVEPLGVGGKFTGRMGNKSVVSKVVPVDEMPYTDTGKRIHVKLNLLAIVNRTTGFVPHEMMINFILGKTRERMATLKTRDEKESLLFEIVEMLNKKQKESMYLTYKNLSSEKKDDYIDKCINEGIHIHEIPIWEDTPIFYSLENILNKYDWLTPYTIYQKKWGQVFETMTKMYVGEMYMIRLKQTSERGFSARSMGAINMKGLPERSYKNRNGTELNSDTAIRSGEFETITLNIGLSPEEIAVFHAYYRTSINARQDLTTSIFKTGKKLKIDDSYTNRVAELFSVIFKSLSLEIQMLDEDDEIRSLDSKIINEHTLEDKTYLMTDYDFYLFKIRKTVKEKVLDQYPIISEKLLDQKIDEEMKHIELLMK